MVVRIPATALSSAARAAIARPTLATAITTASASLSRRCMSSQQPPQQPPQYYEQQQQPPLPQYFPPQQPSPPPKKRRIQRSTYVFLAFGTVASMSTTLFILQKPEPLEEKYPRGSDHELFFKTSEARRADKFPIVKQLQADPAWVEWDVGQRWREEMSEKPARNLKLEVGPQKLPKIPGGELVDIADVSADVTAGRVVAPPTPQRTRLTTGAMGGAEGLGAYHRVFHNASTGEVVSVLRIGRALAGWPGTAHGGALATILDEALGRCAILSFPARTGVTARLELSYRKPVQTGQYYVVRCKPEFPPPNQNGQPQEELRKLWCNATLENIEENTLHVVAKGLFVVPRKYKLGKVEDKF
ncbi:hypothetical protein SBRCBS47491_002434 [Sporothrix bragantina]|uniref:Thioesterase domain-containing protein n=1 Tax=Sporothrix bragantina TaxID=671064 RepID=A0ABP0B733_9PEZI